MPSSCYTEAQKRAIYKYREAHKEEYNNFQRLRSFEYYNRNREEILKKKKIKYQQNKTLNNSIIEV